jgi:hypothetical protein
LNKDKAKVWPNLNLPSVREHTSPGLAFHLKDETLTGETGIRTSSFYKFPTLYQANQVTGTIPIAGRENSQRITKYIDRASLKRCSLIDAYKVFIPKANGSGAFGEALSSPLVGEPTWVCTQTFLTMGEFDNKIEAEHLLKYLKTKLARAMLGVLKTTQDNPRDKWKFVPWQDFTSNSDIDWSKTIAEIDKQLYKKYKLTAAQIKFIEDNVQEMK